MPHVKKAGDDGSRGPRPSPWTLSTPPGSSQYTAYRDEEHDPPALVVQVGTTQLKYQLRAWTTCTRC